VLFFDSIVAGLCAFVFVQLPFLCFASVFVSLWWHLHDNVVPSITSHVFQSPKKRLQENEIREREIIRAELG
jgi:hypothetical protein